MKYIHKVKFYPTAENFTQALLVMLVTNITSDGCALTCFVLFCNCVGAGRPVNI